MLMRFSKLPNKFLANIYAFTAVPWLRANCATTAWILEQVPMEEVVVDNGCMWFIPGSHSKLRPARPAREGCHVLTCDGSEESVAQV